MELDLQEVGVDSSSTAIDFLGNLISSETTFNIQSTTSGSYGDFASKTTFINFDSFKNAKYGRVDSRTFNLGSILIHELVHASTTEQDLVGGVVREAFDCTGPVVDFVNRMRAERGLPLRAAYGAQETEFHHREKVIFNHVNPKRPKKSPI
jgi:hypothetical protein